MKATVALLLLGTLGTLTAGAKAPITLGASPAPSTITIPSHHGTVEVPLPTKDDEDKAVPDDEEDPYFLLSEQADKAIADGRYDDAEARIMEAVSMRPNSPSNLLLLSNLGMVYAYTDRDSMALTTFDHILRQAPAMRTVVGHRARVLLKMGRLQDAYKGYGNLLELDSLSTEGRFYHGMIALMARDVATAERDFGILAATEPEGESTAMAMGTLLTEQSRYREALPYVRRMVKAEPDVPNYALLAHTLIALEEYSEAGSTIAEALERYPSARELYLERAALHRALYELDAAAADERTARRLR